MFKLKKRFLLSIVNTFCVVTLLAQSSVSRPLIWNMEKLEAAKMSSSKSKSIKRILKTSNAYCEMPPVAVTDKTKSFAPNSHYYCSIGGYWWLSEDSRNYVYNDSIKNPERDSYDSGLLSELVERCKYLSVAYYLTEEDRYFDSFLAQIKAWFLDKETYMYPNFEYTAIVPGKKGNKGRVSGLIQAYSFNKVIESIRLINSVKRIDEKSLYSIRKWFLSFARWADKSSFSSPLHKKESNNIGIAYDVMLINMYLFAGEENRAKQIADSFQENRINIQIDEDGKQPAELTRANAFSYSVYNLAHIIDFCFLMQYWDMNYFSIHSQRIDQAFRYLQKYVSNHNAFPYKQTSSGWKSSEKNLAAQQRRKRRLCGETDSSFLPSGYYTINALLQ